MNERTAQILRLLYKQEGEYLSSETLALALKISTRTVLRQMKRLSLLAEDCGFQLDTRKGRGFALAVQDEKRFMEALGNVTAGGDDRAQRAATILLLDDGLKLDSFAEAEHYSRASMGGLGDQLATLLAPFDLSLETRAYQGFRLAGFEQNKRAAIFRLLLGELSLEAAQELLCMPPVDLSLLRQAVYDIVRSQGLHPNDDNLEQFLLLAFLAAARATQGRYTSFAHISLPPRGLVQPRSTQAIDQLLAEDFFHLPETLPQDEQLYWALAYEQCFYSVETSRMRFDAAPDFYEDMVHQAFLRMKQHFGADFTRDTMLRDSLAHHLSTSYGYYLLGLDGDNPYGEAVQEQYPVAHYYTLELAAEINEKTKLPIGRNELGYLTLHLASALERGDANHKVRVAIVCSTAFGTASLLRSLLMKQYASIDLMGVYALHEVEQLRLPVDFFISTLPLEQKTLRGKPVIEISPFLSKKDTQLLSEMIHETRHQIMLTDYFSADQFFFFDKPMKKQTLLHALCDTLIEQGKMNAAEKESVFEREKIMSTEIAPAVAMPHCLTRQSSFLSFAVCRHPISWGAGRVRLVMLGCFREGDTEIKDLLLQIYRTFSNEIHVNELLACTSYDEFASKINAQMQLGGATDVER